MIDTDDAKCNNYSNKKELKAKLAYLRSDFITNEEKLNNEFVN